MPMGGTEKLSKEVKRLSRKISHRHSLSQKEFKVESFREDKIQGGQASRGGNIDDRGDDAESYVDKDSESLLDQSQEHIMKHTLW